MVWEKLAVRFDDVGLSAHRLQQPDRLQSGLVRGRAEQSKMICDWACCHLRTRHSLRCELGGLFGTVRGSGRPPRKRRYELHLKLQDVESRPSATEHGTEISLSPLSKTPLLHATELRPSDRSIAVVVRSASLSQTMQRVVYARFRLAHSGVARALHPSAVQPIA